MINLKFCDHLKSSFIANRCQKAFNSTGYIFLAEAADFEAFLELLQARWAAKLLYLVAKADTVLAQTRALNIALAVGTERAQLLLVLSYFNITFKF